MRKVCFVAAALLCFAVSSSAQVNHPPLRSGATDPATCRITDSAYSKLFYNTAAKLWKFCSNTNTWTALAAGAAGCTVGAAANLVVLQDGAGGCTQDSAFSYDPAANILELQASQFVIAQSSFGVSTPFILHTATWTNGATTYVNFDSDVTDTASAAGSLLFRWRVGGASMLSLTKSGVLTLGGTASISANQIQAPAADLNVQTSGAFSIFLRTNSASRWEVTSAGVFQPLGVFDLGGAVNRVQDFFLSRTIDSAQGTITASAPWATHSATWNAGGVTFNNFDSNVTVTAAANGSTYARFLLGGNVRFALERSNATTGDFQVVARNAANTARVALLDEFLSTAAISKFYGNGTILSWILQSDPGATAPADSQAMRLGIFRDAYGTIGGANMAASIVWRNQATHNEPQFCFISTATCIATTNAFFVIGNSEAGQSTRVQIRAGATQTGNPLLDFRNNANSASFFTVDERGDAVMNTYTNAALPASANGATVYCSDCTKATPCAGGGGGAIAVRIAGAWDCNP